MKWAMATADLDYIRALLIAQTAEPEPQPRGLFGRWGAGRRERRAPLALDAPRPAPRFNPPGFSDPDQELLLEAICGPKQEGAPEGTLGVETASPLRPPAPRDAFGRRPDAVAEVELMLQTPAVEPRRLRVLDDSGSPIGEVILLPEEPPLRGVYVPPEEHAAVPYFPEDLMETHTPRAPEPMRPWIKALRNAGAARPEPVAEPTPETAEDAPLAKRVRTRRAIRKAPQKPQPKPPQTLSNDLLEALAVTLAREHDDLSDRLLAVASESLFHQEMMAPVAA